MTDNAEEGRVSLYRFRYDNMDLDSYLEAMKHRATLLQREAKDKLLMADTIYDEMQRLKQELLPVEPDKHE